MQRLIDADEMKMSKCPAVVNEYTKGWNDAIDAIIENAPTIDAIPISFIEEQAKLCNEIGFRRGEECYMALIEKWREKNGTEAN